jgi:hypothetical protein
MADATATAHAPQQPLRANQELETEKPSHASSLAEAPYARREPGLFSRRRIVGPVVKDFGDYGLLATSFVTGMVDGASFLNWGVFVGMQTGKLHWQTLSSVICVYMCVYASTLHREVITLHDPY